MSEEKKTKKNRYSAAVSSKFDSTSSKKHNRSIINIYEEFLTRVGLEKNPRHVIRDIFYISTILSFLSILSLYIYGYIYGVDLIGFTPIIFIIAIFVAVISFILANLLFLGFLEIRLYNRTKQIEEYLPDFLQLASVNISAGMPLDRALWFSVRSKFGILADEMEEIAKETVAGKDLSQALVDLSEKYDSSILKETVNLINEGMRSGGEMSELLNKISENIYETRLMKKEISASVMTYAIFIGVGSVVAAPMLLALSTQLLTIVTEITADLDFDDGGQGFETFSFDTDGINIGDFQIFSIIIIIITAFFSGAIVSVIRKGNIKGGIKIIPLFILTALGIYFLGLTIFDFVMGDIV